MTRMTQQTADPTLALSTRRMIKAAPAEVFRAWTEPAQLKRWFAVAEGYATPVAEVDLRVGGRYRLGMQPPGAAQVDVATGEYQEVAPPDRLVFTWQWEGAPAGAPVTLVTVLFKAHALGTELILTHEHFDSAASRDQHAAGWQGCLNQLERLITSAAADASD
jgi:uncharacterized protein YndB with AHSA1/START domain